jgi:hypothetical protein
MINYATCWVNPLNGVIATTLAQWGVTEIALIEDTTMLRDEFCLIRLSIQYRGRAILLIWRLISSLALLGASHQSSRGITRWLS